MKPLSTYIEDYENLEREISSFFYKYRSPEEQIALDVNFDFYFPNGFAKLGWPPKTAVEIKNKLNYTIYPLLRKSLDNKRKEYYKSLVFIVAQDVEEKRGKELGSYNGVDIKIIPFADLKESLSSTEELNTSKYKALENIKARAKRDLFSKRVTLFLGAGVSASAGIPSWNTLIEQLCVKNNIDKIDSDVENIVKGRRIVLCYGDNIDDLRRDIKQVLYHNCQSTSSLLQSISKIIDETDVESVITYNYDDLLEIVAEKNNKKNVVLYIKIRAH